MKYRDMCRGAEFEQICIDIFKANAYEVIEPNSLKNKEKRIFDADFLIEPDAKNGGYLVEVKAYGNRRVPSNVLRKAIDKVVFRTHKWNGENDKNLSPLLLVGAIIDPAEKEALSKSYCTTILDASNLLYLSEDNDDLSEKLKGVLGYSVGDIVPEPISFFHNVKRVEATFQKQKGGKYEFFKEQYLNIEAGRDGAFKFEDLCEEILRVLFSEYLDFLGRQKNSSDRMHRFDSVFRIKAGEIEDPWLMFRDYFGSKYVLFEFKNKEKKLQQNDIFITEKYLHRGALRRVAIIVSREGLSKSADRAIRGLLRENEKLIVSLKFSDLLEMIKLREGGDSPSDYLQNRVDSFLINLDR